MKKTMFMSLRQRVSFLSSFCVAIAAGVTLLPTNRLHAQAVTPEWQIAGAAQVDEGSCATYTVKMTAPFSGVATIDLSAADIS